jgi:hypothetical protein
VEVLVDQVVVDLEMVMVEDQVYLVKDFQVLQEIQVEEVQLEVVQEVLQAQLTHHLIVDLDVVAFLQNLYLQVMEVQLVGLLEEEMMDQGSAGVVDYGDKFHVLDLME